MKITVVALILFFLMGYSHAVSQDWVTSYKEAQQLLKQKQYSAAEKKVDEHLNQVTAQFGDISKYHAGGYNLKGKIYYLQGKYDAAIASYNQQKDVIAQTEGISNKSYAQALNNLSVIYQTTGKLDQIEPLLLEAIALKKAAGSTQDSSYAKYINNLAQYYYSIGRYPEAEGLFETSLGLKEKTIGTENSSYALSLFNLGLLKKAVGKSEEAFENFTHSYDLLKKFAGPKTNETISAAIQLSIMYTERGEKSKAQELLNLAESSISSSKGVDAIGARSMYDIAQSKIKLDDVEAGLRILERLMPVIEKNLGNGNPIFQKTLNLMGIAYWKNGQIENAYNSLNQSLALTKMLYGENHIEYASALQVFAGILKETGDISEAARFYNQSFEIYRSLISDYFPHYTENEKLRFYSVLKERFEIYNNFVAVNYKTHPSLVSDMYNFHIATKGLILEYAKGLEDKVKSSGDAALIKKAERWRELKKQEAVLSGLTLREVEAKGMDFESIKTEADKLEKEISQKIGIDKSQAIWKDIQNELKPGEAAIEIVRFKYFTKGWSDSTFYAAMIIEKDTKNNPKFVLMEDGHTMDGFHYQTYKKMVKSKFPDSKSYRVYWKSIRQALSDKVTNVYLSLDGVYNNISINSLKISSDKYVLDDLTIKIISNTKELTNPSEPQTASKTARLIGNPDYLSSGSGPKVTNKAQIDRMETKPGQIIISQLPGTQKEVSLIGQKLKSKGWTTDITTGALATESNFKAVDNPEVLHVATHGYFLDDIEELEGGKSFGIELDQAYQNPLLRSGLLFSGASDYLNYDGSSYYNDENGILTAYEAVNLDLADTKLVVLSACETGLGKIMNGEGVFGLQRAFQIAGADNIIMSLWTVNDETTQMLMDEFYSQWLSGKNISDAFIGAQKTIKAKYSHPYYWAPFVLLGKGQ